MQTLSKLSSRQAVLDAIAECDQLGREAFLEKYGFKHSRLYLLKHNENFYDSKAIAGVAVGKQFGTSLKAKEFSGGMQTVVPALRTLGFELLTGTHPAGYLEVGKTYFRKDLVTQFGGQLQAGIWTPKEFPAVFIFSGDSGSAYGYRDEWTPDGVFQYTGEGQEGDMTFTSGNKAIRDHRLNGKDLLLFEDLGKGKGVRYAGLFECASWQELDGLDKNRTNRKILTFNLVPVATAAVSLEKAEISAAPTVKTLDHLRQEAYDASSTPKAEPKTSDVKKQWYLRSAKVRDYVLARAKGVCECCGDAAPFVKKDGSPYLEPHHTTRLADDGPDHPSHVGAVCPTCHRRIHSGEDGDKWNMKLQLSIAAKEAQNWLHPYREKNSVAIPKLPG